MRMLGYTLASSTIASFAATLLASIPAAHAVPALPAPATCESIFFSPALQKEAARAEKEAAKTAALQLKMLATLRKDAAAFFKENLVLPDQSAEQLQLVNSGQLAAVSPVTIEDLVRYEPQVIGTVRNRLVDLYAKLARETGRTIYQDELPNAMGIEPEKFALLLGEGGLFKDFDSIKDMAMAKKPNAFNKVVDLSIFNSERTARLEEALKTRQRFLITTAVANTPIHREFFETLVRAAKEMDAEILVFPSNMQTTGLDPILLDTPGVHIIANTIKLSKNLTLNNIKLLAKQVNPLMGLDDLGARGESQIVGHPKIDMKTIPTIDNDINPHILTTTGAVTLPIYNSRAYVGERTNKLAEARHMLGALLVEKSTGGLKTKFPGSAAASGFFHFRHITYNEADRGFTDVDKFYTANGVAKAQIEAITFPDIHVGEISPVFIETIRGLLKRFKPKFIAIHDLFNGHSISHHEREQLISLAAKFESGKLNVEDELRSVVALLNTLTSIDPNIELRIELSNHDLWINRWIQSGRFMQADHNRAIGLELAAAMMKGKSPLETALHKFGLRDPDRVIFVTEQSWKVEGFELGQHGHLGANGGKGTLITTARATDKSITGHSHITQRRGNNISVGTMTGLRQSYNSNGASSWTNSFATVTKNGEAQLFILNNKEWWAEKPIAAGGKFYLPGYPQIVPNNDPNVGQQIDQYRTR